MKKTKPPRVSFIPEPSNNAYSQAFTVKKVKKKLDGKPLSKEEEKEQKSLEDKLAKSAKQHLRLRKLAKKRNYDDKDSLIMLGALFGIVMNMIPQAEEQYYKFGNERAAYAFNALVSQAREISNDIRMVSDLTQQADRVFQLFLIGYRKYAEALVDDTYRLKKEIASLIKSKSLRKKVEDAIQQFTLKQADRMEAVLSETKDSVDDLMLEPPSNKRKK